MKKLAFPILAFSILGLIDLFIPSPGGSMFSVFLEHDVFRLVLMFVAFGLPAVASLIALRKPAKLPEWLGMAALGGFAIATVKSQIWLMIQNLSDLTLAMQLLVVAILGGVVSSILAVAQDNDRPA